MELLININSIIDDVEKRMIKEESNYIIIELPSIDIEDMFNISDIIKLLKLYIINGFLPIKYDQLDIIFSDFIEKYFVYKMTKNEIYFWSDQKVNDILNKLKTQKYWIYCSIKGWIELALKTGDSLPLLLYAPDQVYISNRPKTDMLMFRQVNSFKYDPHSLIFNKDDIYDISLLIDKDNKKNKLQCLPVTRYASGMSKGLYYNDKMIDYCGTFFYFEPQSTTYLTFNNYKVYRNKYEALKDLRIKSNIFIEVKLPLDKYNRYDENDESIINFIETYYEHPEYYPDDLKMTPIEVYDNNDYYLPNNGINIDFINKLPDKRYYAGEILGLYALEDKFDQEICNLALKLSIDIIVLTHMIGSHQIVTEILDTRPRLNSFSSLAYPILN